MIDRAQWQAASARLDEALALPAGAYEAWLCALRVEDAALADRVDGMMRRAQATALPAPAGFDDLLQRALEQETGIAQVHPGERMGPWLLERPIGEGGMGQVWLARRVDGLYEAQAAIKLLRGELRHSPVSERFARERAALARLNHPAIAKLLDAGISDGQAYLVLEHVDGLMLSDHVALACATVASRVRLLIRIAEAVGHAHAQLIVHRDLKPTNVMVTQAGEPKLLDFGIAGLLDEGDDAGQLTRQVGRGLSLGYAAPEQISGESVGVAADIFSLGVMLYEMLAGTLPFAAGDGSRIAAEYAVLHTEPRRLSELPSVPAGRPADFVRARGDLEAVVAKALRKAPAERYANVTAFVDDLRRWLEHRPVAARRDNRRHRCWLWVRRHAGLAALSGVLLLTLSAGLVASTWQWRRAEAAAHVSDQVTQYLTDLLGNADPDSHAGRLPDVLQLLDRSREELKQRFHDEPDTRLRLLEVLTTTYDSLNRYDLAAPLAREWADLADARHGADDPRAVRARVKLGQIYVPLGPWDRAVAELEPARPRVARVFGSGSEEMRQLLYGLATSYVKTGRIEAAEQALAEAGANTDARYPPGHFERLFHHNFVSILYAAQGRLSDSLAELRKTEAFQRNPPADELRFALVLRRNTLAIQIRLADYERIEERSRELRTEMDRLLGPGNGMGPSLHPELARYHTDRGAYVQALAERDAEAASGANGAAPGARAGAQAARLLARCLARAARPAALRQEAAATLAALDGARPAMGATALAEAWLALARSGLLLGEPALAADALQRLRATAGLDLGQDASLRTRVEQVEAELLRAQGQLARSRELLAGRVALLARSPDQAVPPLWSARLDLAHTLVLMRDPSAGAALAQARGARPPQMPPGHPFDAVHDYLVAVWQGDAEGQARGRTALERLYGSEALQRAGTAVAVGGMF